MRHLNYNHLLYFWSVVREGGVAAAAAVLHITPQTISGQLKLLEQQAGGALLEKRGRRLVTTELGRVAFGFADEIFSRGQELASVLRGAAPRGPRSFTVGVSDAVPKLVSWRVLAPLLASPEQSAGETFRLVCHEGAMQSLLGDLAAHRIDLLLSSSPLPPDSGIKAFSHLLGESDLSFFAAPALARRLRRNFPLSLNQAPFLLPSDRSANRRVLDAWFATQGLAPQVVGEFDDSALIKTFGQGGAGVFAAPTAIAAEIEAQFSVATIGTRSDLRARFYAITTERRIKHPAVAQITAAARADLFALPGS